jgi:hypothetical protein
VTTDIKNKNRQTGPVQISTQRTHASERPSCRNREQPASKHARPPRATSGTTVGIQQFLSQWHVISNAVRGVGRKPSIHPIQQRQQCRRHRLGRTNASQEKKQSILDGLRCSLWHPRQRQTWTPVGQPSPLFFLSNRTFWPSGGATRCRAWPAGKPLPRDRRGKLSSRCSHRHNVDQLLLPAATLEGRCRPALCALYGVRVSAPRPATLIHRPPSMILPVGGLSFHESVLLQAS